MVLDSARILIPTNEQMRSLELDPLFERGVPSRPTRLDALARGEIHEFAVNRFFAVLLASKACQIGTIIRSEHSNINQSARVLD